MSDISICIQRLYWLWILENANNANLLESMRFTKIKVIFWRLKLWRNENHFLFVLVSYTLSSPSRSCPVAYHFNVPNFRRNTASLIFHRSNPSRRRWPKRPHSSSNWSSPADCGGDGDDGKDAAAVAAFGNDEYCRRAVGFRQPFRSVKACWLPPEVPPPLPTPGGCWIRLKRGKHVWSCVT